jgi:hypothetical protein
MPSRFYLTQAQLQPLREPVKRSGDPAATRAECAQVEPAGDADGSPHLAVSVTSVILAGYREPGSYPAGGHYEAIEQGFRARVLSPLLGAIRWRRRVGRCPHGCRGSPVAPVAPALGVLPHQRTGAEVPGMGCRLAGFVPDEPAGRVRHPVTGGSLAAGT